jgi:hypothetical protein
MDDPAEDNVPLIALIEPVADSRKAETSVDDSADVIQQLIDIAAESIAATSNGIVSQSTNDTGAHTLT